MLDWPIIVLCIVLSVSMLILLLYLIDFIKFIKEKREEERIQTLNDTVDKILQYKEVDMSNVVIDLSETESNTNNVYDLHDYNHLRPTSHAVCSDAYIEELASRDLVYVEELGIWVKRQ